MGFNGLRIDLRFLINELMPDLHKRIVAMALGNAEMEWPEHKDANIASCGAAVLEMGEEECAWVQGANLALQFKQQQQERAGVEENSSLLQGAFVRSGALQKGPSACKHPSLVHSWHQCRQVVPFCHRLQQI